MSDTPLHRVWQRRLAWLWPNSIFARMILVLVLGMLAAQFLTSSIWLGVRHAQLLEAPTRLAGQRMADIVEFLDSGQAHDEAMELASHIGQDATLIRTPQASFLSHSQRAQSTANLLERVFHERIPDARSVQLLGLELLDSDGRKADWLTLAGFKPLTVAYTMQTEYQPGLWLHVISQVRSGWQEGNALHVVGDLIWRVYAIRILIVVALVVLAVRWVSEPLSRLAKAAQALERNVTLATPLQEQGPTEVQHAAHAFNQMQKRIIMQLEERDRFLAAVSHDLRTPMTRMRLRLALLDANNHDASIDKLLADLNDMESLVESTLTYIQAEQQACVLQKIDLDSLVHSLCQDLQELGHDIHLFGTAGGPIEADSLSLKRALGNLLDNALRYGQNVQVELAGNASHASVDVRNDGPPIPPSLLLTITQPFIRGEPSRNTMTGGYGLGLSIVDAIARSHHGQLRISNRPQHAGVSAYLELPRTAPAQAKGH